jgi:hypothetical protein
MKSLDSFPAGSILSGLSAPYSDSRCETCGSSLPCPCAAEQAIWIHWKYYLTRSSMLYVYFHLMPYLVALHINASVMASGLFSSFHRAVFQMQGLPEVEHDSKPNITSSWCSPLKEIALEGAQQLGIVKLENTQEKQCNMCRTAAIGTAQCSIIVRIITLGQETYGQRGRWSLGCLRVSR